jgi:peroxiredoxin
MSARIHILSITLLLAGALPAPSAVHAQRAISAGDRMPEITLPIWQGGTFTLSQMQGRNVLLIFPRGLAGDHWCHICHYQYAELVELEERLDLRDTWNLEIVFVLPYARERIDDWVGSFPSQLADIESWKNPADPSALSEGARSWMEYCREAFPAAITWNAVEVRTPFPILIDSNHSVSSQFDLFRTEWSNTPGDQNVPAIFLVDSGGTIQLKYISQNTFDRPDPAYLLRVFTRLLPPAGR